MPTYQYTAVDAQGNNSEHTIDAPNQEAAMDLVRNQNLILLSIKEKKGSIFSADLAIGKPRVKAKDVVVFSRQLSVLISATVPIVRALRILSKQTESKALQKVITTIAAEVDGGARLSAAMKQHDTVFDDFFVYMIRAGETTGRLDEVLVYLADQKEKDYKLLSKVIGSMIYPAFIVTVLVVIFIFMLVYVIPQMLDVVTRTGAELPVVTKILIATSEFAQSYWLMIVAFIIIAIGSYMAVRRRPAVKQVVDRIKLHIPVLGRIFRNVYLARISRSLSNLLAAGVPVNRSIDIVADIVGNYHYREIMRKGKADIEGGTSLSVSLSESKYIPQMMTQMMSIGEETGRSDQILEKVSDFYMSEVDSLTQALASLIEPMILIIIGIGAAVLVSGILLPMYSITTQF